MLHCDLKPQNIQVTPYDAVQVLDFGVARAVYGPSTAEIVTGTVPYMAPEQIAERRFTEVGDIYSLGVTVFELITGQRPFAAEHPHDVLLQILGLPAPRASALAPGVPAALDELLDRTLAKVSPLPPPVDARAAAGAGRYSGRAGTVVRHLGPAFLESGCGRRYASGGWRR